MKEYKPLWLIGRYPLFCSCLRRGAFSNLPSTPFPHIIDHVIFQHKFVSGENFFPPCKFTIRAIRSLIDMAIVSLRGLASNATSIGEIRAHHHEKSVVIHLTNSPHLVARRHPIGLDIANDGGATRIGYQGAMSYIRHGVYDLCELKKFEAFLLSVILIT